MRYNRKIGKGGMLSRKNAKGRVDVEGFDNDVEKPWKWEEKETMGLRVGSCDIRLPWMTMRRGGSKHTCGVVAERA